jgi:hypothetical protein
MSRLKVLTVRDVAQRLAIAELSGRADVSPVEYVNEGG